MKLWRNTRLALAGAVLLAVAGSAAAQHGATLTALKTIERGQWQFRERDDGTVHNMCLANPASLLQLRHGSAQCSQFVVEDEPNAATIHYTCPGHGYGRTTVSVETPRLVRVDTQGILDGAPFAEDLEGRRTGACG